MLHLSAKRHRFIIWWKDTLWKTFWETIWRTYYSMWFIGEVLPNNCGRISPESIEGPVDTQSLYKIWLLNGFQSYPCKTNTSLETDRSLRKFLEPSEKPEVTNTDNSLEFGNSWKTSHWSIVLPRAIDPRRMRLLRVVRRIQEGTSAVLLQSGLDEKWWADSMEFYCFLRNIQDLLTDEKTPYERRFRRTIQPSGALVVHDAISPKDQSRFSQYGKKVSPGIFIRYALTVVRIWKGDILVADIEELENMGASEIHPRRINAKEVFGATKGWFFFTFPVADGTAKLSGRDHEFREDLSGELQGEPEGPQPTEPKDDAEARNDFWSMEGDFVVITSNLEFMSMCRKKNRSNPVEVYGREQDCAHMSGCVARKRVNDDWNVDVDRTVSDSWTGFTKLTQLNEKHPKGCRCSGRRFTKIQTTTRPDYLWPGIWSRMSEAAKKKEKQEWASEEPTFDKARKLRGIYFIDLEDG